MKIYASAVSAALLAFAAPAHAETCALDDPDFVPPANDSSAPAANLILMSVGLDGDGEFIVESAARPNGQFNYAWQLDDMAGELAPHDAGDGATPFDLEVSEDTVMVFNLAPGAWKWEADPAKALFLKDGQTHNPFTIAEDLPGRPRMMAARFHAPEALAGCSFDYNLGVVVKQGGRATPLIIDPRIKNKNRD